VTRRSGSGGPLLIALAVGALLAGVGSTVGGQALPAGLASGLGLSDDRDPPLPRYLPTSATTTIPAPLAAPPSPAPAATSSTTALTLAAPSAHTTLRPAPATTSTKAPAPRTTTPARPAAPPAPSAPAAGTPAAEVVALTNQQRARSGCGALRVDARITAAAQKHSADMAANDYFDHDSKDGRDFADRIRAEGYPSPAAENIAQGQRSAEEVVTSWMESPGHRENILDCALTTIGVGYSPDGNYWTQDFGR
jgi:uncharacterized protein YkwD